MLLTLPAHEPVHLTLVRSFGLQCGPYVLYSVIFNGQERLLAATPSVAALLSTFPVDLPFALVSHETSDEAEALKEVQALKEINEATLAKLRELQAQLAGLLTLTEGN